MRPLDGVLCIVHWTNDKYSYLKRQHADYGPVSFSKISLFAVYDDAEMGEQCQSMEAAQSKLIG